MIIDIIETVRYERKLLEDEVHELSKLNSIPLELGYRYELNRKVWDLLPMVAEMLVNDDNIKVDNEHLNLSGNGNGVFSSEYCVSDMETETVAYVRNEIDLNQEIAYTRIIYSAGNVIRVLEKALRGFYSTFPFHKVVVFERNYVNSDTGNPPESEDPMIEVSED